MALTTFQRADSTTQRNSGWLTIHGWIQWNNRGAPVKTEKILTHNHSKGETERKASERRRQRTELGKNNNRKRRGPESMCDPGRQQQCREGARMAASSKFWGQATWVPTLACSIITTCDLESLWPSGSYPVPLDDPRPYLSPGDKTCQPLFLVMRWRKNHKTNVTDCGGNLQTELRKNFLNNGKFLKLELTPS